MSQFDLPLDELRAYLPERDEPADFDAFWRATLDEARTAARPPRFEPAYRELRAIETYDVTFTGFADQEIKVIFFGATELGEGSKWEVGADNKFGASVPHIHTGWNVAGKQLPEMGMHINKYALKLEFGKAAGGKIPCKIHLSLPDAAKSFLAGSFSIDASAFAGSKVHGTITIKGEWKKPIKIDVGYVGQSAPGKPKSGYAGFTIAPGNFGSVSSFATKLESKEGGGITFTHGRVPPGSYLVLVTWDEKSLDWRWIDVKDQPEIRIDLTIDPTALGELEVKLPADAKNRHVQLLPLDKDGQLPKSAGNATSLAIQLSNHGAATQLEAPAGKDRVKFTAVRAGIYRVVLGDKTADATVAAGKMASVEVK